MKYCFFLLVLEEINIPNFNFEREGSYIGINAYMNSKQAMIMSGYKLARLLKGSGVTVNSVCPGLARVHTCFNN